MLTHRQLFVAQRHVRAHTYTHSTSGCRWCQALIPSPPCFFFRKCCVAFLNRKCSFITSSQKMSHFGNSFRIDVIKNAFKHKKTSRWTTQGAGLWCDYRQMIVILREEWFFFSFRVAFVKRISENKLWNGSLYLFKIICAYYVCYIIVIFLF